MPATKTIGVPNLLMVAADMPDDLAYRVTKLLFDGKERLATVHKAAESLDPKTAREVVAPVQLHPGAQRYYDGGRRMRRVAAGLAGRAAVRRRASLAAQRAATAARASSCARRAATRSSRPTPRRRLRARLPPLRLPRARGGALPRPRAAAASTWSRSRRASEAVLDYYGIDGRAGRGAAARGCCGPRAPPHFETLALAGTALGRRTLVAAGARDAAVAAGGARRTCGSPSTGGERG